MVELNFNGSGEKLTFCFKYNSSSTSIACSDKLNIFFEKYLTDLSPSKLSSSFQYTLAVCGNIF